MERPSHKQTKNLKPRVVLAAITGLGILSAAVYLVNFRIHDLVPGFSGLSGIQLYVVMFLFLSVLYLGGVVLVLKTIPNEATSRALIGVIILSAIIFRLSLIPSDPTVLSKDMYRYIWDGRVQQNGINPYHYPPGADELKNMRDDRIYPHINRKDYPTLYPAGAQVFFRICHALVGDSVIGFKAIMVLFDTLTLLVLVALLQNHGLNRSRILIYAWNPLVIFEIAYSGHLEGLTVFLMVAALYLSAIHKKIPGIFMLALSAAVKLYPAILLAAFLNRGGKIKGLLAFLLTILLLYLPFIGAGNKLSGFLPVYLKNPYESFNLGLKYLLMRLFPGIDYYLLSLLFIIFLGIGGLVVFVKNKEDIEVSWYAYFLTGLLMILMPASLHPWYVILIIPFLVIYPSAAWLIFTCTVTLSYLHYTSPQGKMPTWILLTEYLPLFALLAAGFILREYNKRQKNTGMDLSRKKKEMSGGLIMKKNTLILTVSIIFAAGLCQPVSAADFEHSVFDRILKTYVNDLGRVDYNGIAGDPSFKRYMESLKTAQADTMSRNGQLAFWINAYNAVTIDKVIKSKPKKSVRETFVPGVWTGTKFFTTREHTVAGRQLSQDDIENEILRKQLQEPRIHFAIVCASSSCPPLPRFAYTEDNVQAKLEEETGKYVNSDRGTQIDSAKNTLYLSKLFDWFAGDFEYKSGSVMNFIKPYLDKKTLAFVEQEPKIEFIPYDWALNAQEPLK